MLRGSYSNRLGLYPAKSKMFIGIYLIPSKYNDIRWIRFNFVFDTTFYLLFRNIRSFVIYPNVTMSVKIFGCCNWYPNR
jgi:hypothetical protein